MNYTIEPNTFDLIISVDAEEREGLRLAQGAEPAFYSDAFMYDTIEYVWTNGLSNAIQPEQVGALTAAPMLCEYNADNGDPRGKVWAFMDYQVRSVLQDLVDYGSARWQYGGTFNDDGSFADETEGVRAPTRSS